MVNRQRVKTTEAGGERGDDAGKKVKGRKRTLLVDTQGLVLRVLVHTADSQESEGAAWLLATVCRALPDRKHIWVATGYKEWVIQTATTSYAITLEQVAKPAAQRGFAVPPRRWVIERTCAWLGRGRRLRTDDERLPENSEDTLLLAWVPFFIQGCRLLG